MVPQKTGPLQLSASCHAQPGLMGTKILLLLRRVNSATVSSLPAPGRADARPRQRPGSRRLQGSGREGPRYLPPPATAKGLT